MSEVNNLLVLYGIDKILGGDRYPNGRLSNNVIDRRNEHFSYLPAWLESANGIIGLLPKIASHKVNSLLHQPSREDYQRRLDDISRKIEMVKRDDQP